MNKKTMGGRRGARIGGLLLGPALLIGAASLVVHALRSAAAIIFNATLPLPWRLAGGTAALIAVVLTFTLAYGLWRTRIYRGTRASFQPAEPAGGAAFNARWILPPRAAETLGGRAPLRLRVAQYRVNDELSGSPQTRVQDFVQDVQPRQERGGGLVLQACFELPADAPTHGSRREGESVEWRLELIGPNERIELSEPIPVRAAMPEPAQDRFARAQRTDEEEVPPALPGDRMPALPEGVNAREQADALVLNFASGSLRWSGLVSLVLTLALYTALWPRLGFFGATGCAVLLAIALHAMSLRSMLEVRDDGLVIRHVSLLWQRRHSLPTVSLERHLYLRERQRTSGVGTMTLRELWSRGGPMAMRLQLTPGFRGDGAARVAQMLRWAHAQRCGRFSPGAQRTESASHSGPGWGWVLWLFLVVAGLAAAG